MRNPWQSNNKSQTCKYQIQNTDSQITNNTVGNNKQANNTTKEYNKKLCKIKRKN